MAGGADADVLCLAIEAGAAGAAGAAEFEAAVAGESESDGFAAVFVCLSFAGAAGALGTDAFASFELHLLLLVS